MPVEPFPGDDSTSPSTNSSAGSVLPELPNKDLNRRIAVVSGLAAVALFLSSRLDFGVSLKDLAATAMPYEEVFLFLVVVS